MPKYLCLGPSCTRWCCSYVILQSFDFWHMIRLICISWPPAKVLSFCEDVYSVRQLTYPISHYETSGNLLAKSAICWNIPLIDQAKCTLGVVCDVVAAVTNVDWWWSSIVMDVPPDLGAAADYQIHVEQYEDHNSNIECQWVIIITFIYNFCTVKL